MTTLIQQWIVTSSSLLSSNKYDWFLLPFFVQNSSQMYLSSCQNWPKCTYFYPIWCTYNKDNGRSTTAFSDEISPTHWSSVASCKNKTKGRWMLCLFPVRNDPHMTYPRLIRVVQQRRASLLGGVCSTEAHRSSFTVLNSANLHTSLSDFPFLHFMSGLRVKNFLGIFEVSNSGIILLFERGNRRMVE